MERYTREERKKLRALKRLSSARDSEFEGFITHSALYHRVYEGYSERQVPKENGRGMRIERVYVGNYFERQNTGVTLTAAKVLYPLLFLLAALCAVFAFSRPSGYNSVWYGVIPMFALIILMILFLYELFACLTSPKRMELYHYNCFLRLMKSALRTAVVAFVYSLLAVVFLFLGIDTAGTGQAAAAGALTGVLFLVLFFLERRAGYTVIENQTDCAQDAVVIS